MTNQQLLEICDTYGAPVYVYDAHQIENQYKTLTSAFSHVPVKIKYACKALSNINVLKFLKQLGSGIDTVSIQEVELALLAGYDPSDIIFTPNCVAFDEIKRAVDKGVVINIDNISVLELFGNEYGDTVPVCVRINPHIMAGGNYQISTGHIDSKFGISIYQMRHVERIIETTKLNVKGLHMHTGSDILEAEVFLQGAEILFEQTKLFPNLDFIDFGSGFKVAYKEGELSTDIEDLGRKLGDRFNEFCTAYGKQLELWFEPGKYLVSSAGTFCASVNVLKQTTATVFAGLDSGMNHLMRPKLYNAYHQIHNISNPSGAERIYTVVGYICETDTFGWDRKINEISEGDILAFKNAGAYGFSMASNYNSRYRPAEVLWINNQAHLIRKRETFEDIIQNQVVLDYDTLLPTS